MIEKDVVVTDNFISPSKAPWVAGAVPGVAWACGKRRWVGSNFEVWEGYDGNVHVTLLCACEHRDVSTWLDAPISAAVLAAIALEPGGTTAERHDARERALASVLGWRGPLASHRRPGIATRGYVETFGHEPRPDERRFWTLGATSPDADCFSEGVEVDAIFDALLPAMERAFAGREVMGNFSIWSWSPLLTADARWQEAMRFIEHTTDALEAIDFAGRTYPECGGFRRVESSRAGALAMCLDDKAISCMPSMLADEFIEVLCKIVEHHAVEFVAKSELGGPPSWARYCGCSTILSSGFELRWSLYWWMHDFPERQFVYRI